MLLFMILITFFSIAYGSYNIAVDRLKLPSMKTEKVAQTYVKNKSLAVQTEIMAQRVASRLEKHIHLDEYKRGKLEQELKSLGMEQTPENYRAMSIVVSASVLFLVIPCLFLFPLASIGVVIVSMFIYFKSENDLRERIQKKKEEIELELPRFCCTIKQELMATKDVLTILENYRKNAGPAMKKELDITCADMRSGNYESGLLRFEARITSAALSDVVRGLLGTLRGDDNRAYFEILSHDMDEMEKRRLEAIAAKRPGKIKKYLMLLLVSLLLMYIVILVVYAMSVNIIF